MTLKKLSIIFGLCMISFLLTFCSKESFTTDPSDKLSFSTDTLSFDTVFTTVASVTKEFLIFNPNNKRIKINKLQLGKGKDSPFRMNIDGVATYEIEEVEIWANDSLHVFVEVTVDPTDENAPFVIEDAIVFETNGNIQEVQLVAWGQNAHFYGPGTPNDFLVKTSTWTNDKPYVIYDGIVVDSLETLTIEKGTKIYLHNGARFFVQGTLLINGGKDTSDWVRFQGTRLEESYQDIPGQWGGIHFLRGSIDNKITGALIKNCVVGIRVDSLPISGNNPNLILQNTIIQDTQDSGILGLTAQIVASNCLIFSCGRHNVQLEYGGDYLFSHCTLVNYGYNFALDHKNPIVRVGNFISDGESVVDARPVQARFFNSIVYGNEEEEIFLENGTEEEDWLKAKFVNTIVRTEISRDSIIFEDIIYNPKRVDTLFVNEFNGNYHLNEQSPAINQGVLLGDIPLISLFDMAENDMDCVPRDIQPDLGCYEFK